jgi:hypothetical protein
VIERKSDGSIVIFEDFDAERFAMLFGLADHSLRNVVMMNINRAGWHFFSSLRESPQRRIRKHFCFLIVVLTMP